MDGLCLYGASFFQQIPAEDEVSYRLALAKGFLAEAEQDMTLERWRSCVDNSQLAVENVGKTIHTTIC